SVNVDLRHDCLSRGWSDSQHIPALAAHFRDTRNRSSEHGGSSLSMAADRILATLDEPFVDRRRLVDSAVFVGLLGDNQTRSQFSDCDERLLPEFVRLLDQCEHLCATTEISTSISG